MALKSEYLKSFLTLPIDGKAFVFIPANELNPLLRCLEIMQESCLIESVLPKEKNVSMFTDALQGIHYKVYRKMPQLPEIDVVEEKVPGITLVKRWQKG